MKNIRDLIQNINGPADRAHAYIVEGNSEILRERFVNELLSALECHAADVVFMERSGKSGYKTEDAARFSERLRMNPYGNYLAGVIYDAELLSETVQNKLLKTLEEPPERVLIFMTASRSDELLGTVRSRCSPIRISDYEGYDGSAESERSDDLMRGALMMITQRSAFYEFREFADKQIKTREDAIDFIALTEDRLRDSMLEGRGTSICSDMIEIAERTSMDIINGMDKNKALKRMYLEFYNSEVHSK